MTAQPVITELVELYDVDSGAIADGQAVVRDGDQFIGADLAASADLTAEASARAAADATKVTGAGHLYIGAVDPATLGLAPGTEYVWFETDGLGDLIDLIAGVS